MDAISFARGIPSPELLPADDLAECARSALARFGPVALHCGRPGGFGPLREWIAEQHGVAPSRVVVTNGSLQGFSLLAEHVVARAGVALVEEPTYDRSLAALRRLRAPVEPVPLGEDGIDVEAVLAALGAREPPALLYTIPTFQNPTGRTLSPDKRRTLAELVVGSRTLLYEDDPYRLVRFEGDNLPTVHELARGENVVFASSFSKTVAPGLRVGYLVLPGELVPAIETIALTSYITPSPFVQAVLLEYILQGRFASNLEGVRAQLRTRRDAMVGALARELADEEVSWSEPEGGYFVWLELPPEVDAASLLPDASEEGVTFVPGRDFHVHGGGSDALRLAYSSETPGAIEEGVARLARLVRRASTASRPTALRGTSTPR